LAAVGAVAERLRRGCAARGSACRGGGARGGVDDDSMSFGRGDGGVIVLRHSWVKQEREVRSSSTVEEHRAREKEQENGKVNIQPSPWSMTIYSSRSSTSAAASSQLGVGELLQVSGKGRGSK
jgi:hypothetical protein